MPPSSSVDADRITQWALATGSRLDGPSGYCSRAPCCRPMGRHGLRRDGGNPGLRGLHGGPRQIALRTLTLWGWHSEGVSLSSNFQGYSETGTSFAFRSSAWRPAMGYAHLFSRADAADALPVSRHRPGIVLFGLSSRARAQGFAPSHLSASSPAVAHHHLALPAPGHGKRPSSWRACGTLTCCRSPGRALVLPGMLSSSRHSSRPTKWCAEAKTSLQDVARAPLHGAGWAPSSPTAQAIFRCRGHATAPPYGFWPNSGCWARPCSDGADSSAPARRAPVPGHAHGARPPPDAPSLLHLLPGARDPLPGIFWFLLGALRLPRTTPDPARG